MFVPQGKEPLTVEFSWSFDRFIEVYYYFYPKALSYSVEQ